MTKIIQYGFKLTDKVIPGTYDYILPNVEKFSKYTAIAVPLTIGLLFPKETKQAIIDNTVYWSGIAGGLMGGITAANQNLNKKYSN